MSEEHALRDDVARVSVKLERGQKGGYAWEVKMSIPFVPPPGHHPMVSDLEQRGFQEIEALGRMDQELRRRFGLPQGGQGAES